MRPFDVAIRQFTIARIAHGRDSAKAGRARNAAMVALTWLEGPEWEVGAARFQLASRGRVTDPQEAAP